MRSSSLHANPAADCRCCSPSYVRASSRDAVAAGVELFRRAMRLGRCSNSCTQACNGDCDTALAATLGHSSTGCVRPLMPLVPASSGGPHTLRSAWQLLGPTVHCCLDVSCNTTLACSIRDSTCPASCPGSCPVRLQHLDILTSHMAACDQVAT